MVRVMANLATSAVALIVLAVALNVRDIADASGLKIPPLHFPYGDSGLDNLISVVLVVTTAFLLSRRAPLALKSLLGLDWQGFKAPALVLLSTVPCWIGLALQGGLAQGIDPLDVLMLSVLFPIAEEITYRGFGFVFFRRALHWPWLAAALVQAFVFGAVHWQGAGGGGGVALQIFFITLSGGVLFAALDTQDRYSIWSGWVFHASLNLAWSVFAVSDSAATGWVGNLLRITSALLALFLLHRFVHARHIDRA